MGVESCYLARIRRECVTLADRGQPVLVLGEAHLLRPRLLHELRLFLNYQLDSMAPVALVLCGHAEPRHKLAVRPLDAIRQRVRVTDHPPPLTAAEAGSCVTPHLAKVGVERPVFTDHALQTGREGSRGRVTRPTPRPERQRGRPSVVPALCAPPRSASVGLAWPNCVGLYTWVPQASLLRPHDVGRCVPTAQGP